MTVKDLRARFPFHDFYFFHEGKEVRGVWYHSPIKGYQKRNKQRAIYIFL